VSSTPAYAAPNGLAAAAPTNFFVAVIILGLFVLAASVSAERKAVTRGFDEVAQVSYVAQIQHSGNPWPALPTLRMLDPQTFRFTSEPSYLAHPPIFFALLAALGPTLEGHPEAVVVHRLIDVGLAAIGLAALLGLGLAARFSRQEFYAYAVPIACIPMLVPIAGAVNNDDLAFLGGTAATLGVWQLIATNRKIWLTVALAGLVAAGCAKLTAFVLVGIMVGAVIAYLLWRKRISWSMALIAALAFVAAAAPYIVYIVQYGAPVPNTPGFFAFVDYEVHEFAWIDLPRLSFPHYFIWFTAQFIASWMPTLADRNPLQYAMLAIPIVTLGFAAAGLAASLRRLWRRQETAIDVVVIGGALAFPINFALQIAYTYHFYAATGWQAGTYLRFYLPLAAIVPLACLSLVAAIQSPRWRGGLLAFFIAGPIAFRLFGAPL
jgi:hypothetical protein